jgi:hypothetical protein
LILHLVALAEIASLVNTASSERCPFGAELGWADLNIGGEWLAQQQRSLVRREPTVSCRPNSGRSLVMPPFCAPDDKRSSGTLANLA